MIYRLRKHRALWFLCWGVIWIFVLLVVCKLFYKYIYFPRYPVAYSYYTAVPRTQTTDAFDILHDADPGPPIGLCEPECWGKTEKGSCSPRGRNYEVCTAKCYGYVYTSCMNNPLTTWFYAFVTE